MVELQSNSGFIIHHKNQLSLDTGKVSFPSNRTEIESRKEDNNLLKANYRKICKKLEDEKRRSSEIYEKFRIMQIEMKELKQAKSLLEKQVQILEKNNSTKQQE